MIIRNLPVYIAWEASVDSLLRRQLVVTYDDLIFILLMFSVQESSSLPEDDYVSNIFNYGDTPAKVGVLAAQAEEEEKGTKSDELSDLANLNISNQMTMKEREKIYIAAELVQKNYLELRREQAS